MAEALALVDAWHVKDHRHNARVRDVGRVGCSPASDVEPAIVSAGHLALDRAMARAAVRSAAHPPRALRAARLAPMWAAPASSHDGPALAGHRLDAVHLSAGREDMHARVMHVSTVREVTSRSGLYRIRTWHEVSTLSAN
jgi:hypothetical protein